MNARKYYSKRLEEDPSVGSIQLMEEYASQSKWVSVEERLPEKGEQVLVWANEVKGEIYHNVSEPSCVKVAFNTLKHSSAYDSDYYDVVASGITHWQPLPKAPEK